MLKARPILVLIGLAPWVLFAQPGIVATVAGGYPLGDGGPATAAQLILSVGEQSVSPVVTIAVAGEEELQ